VTRPDVTQPQTPQSRGQVAVVRTYHELRGKGQPDRFAFEAALTVYFWHHPLVPAAEAGQIVAGWVQASGPGERRFH
jgi:hypothetical protein